MKVIKNGKIEDKKDEDFITQLEELQFDGYVFRGQADSKWTLTPSAFRIDNIKKAAQEFPTTTHQIMNEWFYAPKLEEFIKICFSNNIEYTDLLTCYPTIKKFYDLWIIIMRYNYSFRKELISKNMEYILEETDKRTLHLELEYWQDKNTFINYVLNDFLTLREGIRKNDAKIIKKAEPKNYKPIALKEELPQHYGVPTTVLDWTYNPYKAIYFALDLNDGVLYIFPENVPSHK